MVEVGWLYHMMLKMPTKQTGRQKQRNWLIGLGGVRDKN